MAHTTEESKWIIVVFFLLILGMFSGWYVALWEFLQPKARATCSSFASYEDIPSDWKTTNPRLDGNHDGIPCQSLYRAWQKAHNK